MKCFFGHKFGKIESDGFQYCLNCGMAKKPAIPHPCENGHIWVTDPDMIEQKLTTHDFEGTRTRLNYKLSQTCKVCGRIQGVMKY